jgi:hypothetical protein
VSVPRAARSGSGRRLAAAAAAAGERQQAAESVFLRGRPRRGRDRIAKARRAQERLEARAFKELDTTLQILGIDTRCRKGQGPPWTGPLYPSFAGVLTPPRQGKKTKNSRKKEENMRRERCCHVGYMLSGF